MSIKKFLGLLMVLTVAIFTFTAYSSDDADEKVGTFEYAATCSSYEGSFDSMQKVDDAFLHAFGVTSTPITLTGTKSECNRKAKEYAMKAQAALANEGRFAADVEFVNVTTDEQIYAFSVKKNDNAFNKFEVKYEVEYTSNYNKYKVTVYDMKGYRIWISPKGRDYKRDCAIFDGIVTEDKQNFDIGKLGSEKGIVVSVGIYVLIFEGTGTEPIGHFRVKPYRKK